MIIQYNDSMVDMDERYSSKDFTSIDFVDIADGVNVYCSCFSHENPDTQVFRPDMTGVMFYNCNLNNCVIPPGNTVVGG